MRALSIQGNGKLFETLLEANMTRKTHIAVGLAVTLPLLNIFPQIAIIGMVASIFPDINLAFLKIKRRTITHSVLAFFACTIFVMAINISVGILFGVNYLIHMVLDSFTNMGIPLFYPFVKRRYGPRLILTGSIVELYICLLCIFSISTAWYL